MSTPRKASLTAALAVLAVFSTSCSSTYDERMDFLRTAAQRGVANHRFIESQGGIIDKARCDRAYDGTDAGDDRPYTNGGQDGIDWEMQVREYFNESCVSGLPKPVPGDPVPTLSPSPKISVTER